MFCASCDPLLPATGVAPAGVGSSNKSNKSKLLQPKKSNILSISNLLTNSEIFVSKPSKVVYFLGLLWFLT